MGSSAIDTPSASPGVVRTVSESDAPQVRGDALGVDVGGTKIAVAVTRGAEVVEHVATPTPTDDLPVLLDAIVALVAPRLATHGFTAVGACAPGLLDPDTGVTRYASNVPALDGVNLGEALGERLRVPVRVHNDANAAAWAEHRYGAAVGWRSVFFLTVSTGVGGGYVGECGVHRGRYGYAADVGHMTLVPGGERCSCGELGCLEAYTSGQAVAARASRAYGRRLTTQEAFARARAGEAPAREVVDTAARYLGLGLATTAKILDPEGIVVGGGVATHEPWFVEEVRRHLGEALRNFRPVPLEVARLGPWAGVIGAAGLGVGEGTR